MTENSLGIRSKQLDCWIPLNVKTYACKICIKQKINVFPEFWSPTIQIPAHENKIGFWKNNQVIMVPRNIRIHSKYFWEHQSGSLSIAPTKHHGEQSFQPLCSPSLELTPIQHPYYRLSTSVQIQFKTHLFKIAYSVQLCSILFYCILLFITYYFIVCSFCLFYGIYSILVKCP